MDSNSRQETLHIPAISRDIVVYHYGSGDKKVLLVHGWSGRGTQLAVIAKALVDEGYGVISFDAPAHGKAPGKISMMPFFIEAVQFLEKKYGPFETAIGHSLGGMAALRAVKDGMKLQKLVILGTANSITHITRDFARNMKLSQKVADKMKLYLDGKFKKDMDTYSGAVSARKVNVATLVIHDKHDVDVPVSSAYEIHDSLENSELFLTEHLGHRRILGDASVIERIVNFLKTR